MFFFCFVLKCIIFFLLVGHGAMTVPSGGHGHHPAAALRCCRAVHPPTLLGAEMGLLGGPSSPKFPFTPTGSPARPYAGGDAAFAFSFPMPSPNRHLRLVPPPRALQCVSVGGDFLIFRALFEIKVTPFAQPPGGCTGGCRPQGKGDARWRGTTAPGLELPTLQRRARLKSK